MALLAISQKLQKIYSSSKSLKTSQHHLIFLNQQYWYSQNDQNAQTKPPVPKIFQNISASSWFFKSATLIKSKWPECADEATTQWSPCPRHFCHLAKVSVFTCSYLFIHFYTCFYLFLPVSICFYLFLPILPCYSLFLPGFTCLYIFIPRRFCHLATVQLLTNIIINIIIIIVI